MSNEIYTLSGLQQEPDMLSATISYDAAHPVFEGHFPGNPIVPGVCTLNMISDLVRMHVGENYVIKDASNVKFLQLIRPEDKPAVKLSWKQTDAGLQVTCTLQADGVILMRFSGLFVHN